MQVTLQVNFITMQLQVQLKLCLWRVCGESDVEIELKNQFKVINFLWTIIKKAPNLLCTIVSKTKCSILEFRRIYGREKLDIIII